MHRFLSILFPVVMGPTIVASVVLIQHLGSGTVPQRLQPIANLWINAGGDPRRVRLALWLLFSLLAGSFFASMILLTYPAIRDLGRVGQ